LTLSALFSVNGSTTVQAHPANYDATVTFVIQSLTGIETIAWSVVGTSKSDQAALAVSLSGTPSGATATVTMPSDPGDGLGRAFMMKLRVTGEGTSAVHYAIFGKANSAGIIPAVVGEENVRNATHGWTDIFNQALNAIGGAAGSSGQLLYNNAGSIDGASGISVVGSETALAFGSTPASTGTIRGSNGFGLYVRNSENTADVFTIGVGSDEVVQVGDGTNAPEVDIKASNFIDLMIGATVEFRVSASTLDCNQNSITDVEHIALGSGTVSGQGLIRIPHGGGQVLVSARNQAGSADVAISTWGIGGNDWLIWGGATALNIYSTATGGTHIWWINNVTEMTLSATGLDLADNALTNVGDFDHDGTNLGFYGTAPIAKQTVTGAKGGNAALADLIVKLENLGLLNDSTS
jgi:hypothetical protein